MKVAIGFRVSSNKYICYTITKKNEKDEIEYLDTSRINVPLVLKNPEKLNFLRNTVIDIIAEYGINRAVIRIPEFFHKLKKLSIERMYIEGVLQECLAGSSVEFYLAGEIAQIHKLLDIPKTDFKKYASATKTYPNIPEDMDWKTNMNKEKRESYLSSIAALNL